ncbi:hypothetical protein G6F57_005416 [Rhizopus arrhizus]|uniref:Velvet domain-containing protein n=1 Tax=Rhizopus oryzae TaxID=64495 RepID=A0A9P6XFL9_RHIOR|nr:hypothetical protein G6F23_002345 [Rhizopus arrhizus]KAG1420516.1 hypothetical protein G6F58_004161 [Rhizopus delemar]KAG0940704.1 hypothetical protein G6F30_006575 [Rhizopus arrhizus]KAG0981573.1 hypothetical protein G6F29_006951 [Rhizopus arrhizus]KAG0999884.1 hypothetical protein G6F28_000599 [Rhizopus arrhizus]
MSGDSDLHFINGNSTTAGAVVQSPHKLKDLDGRDGGFFIFSDISVRLEGVYRLKFTLFEIEGNLVNRLCSILSDPFKVYLPKNFPGMSDQGVRIRVRKEPRSTRLSHNSNKRRRTNLNESDDEGPSLHNSVIEKRQQESSLPPVSCFGGLPSPQDYIIPQHEDRPNLPPPKQLFQSSAMSMQNILSKNRSQLCHISAIDYRADENRLISTRKLPLPYQEQTKCYQNGITELLNTDPSSFTWFSKN